MTAMHARMQENYPQSNASQMTYWMREQFTQDNRIASYGTMTDMHVFGGGKMGHGRIGGVMNGGVRSY